MDQATIQEVTLKPIEGDLNGELSDEIIYDCGYCEKTVKIHEDFRRMCASLSGDYYYCPFCLRHGYNTKKSKHILILSFRAIFGYYYYNYYSSGKIHNKLSWSEVHSFILSHRDVGLLNPIFNYDPETFLWFVDFSKIGKKGKGKKIELNDVLKTISNILACFNLDDVLTNPDIPELYLKYANAIQQFYEQRSRPEGKRMLIPTLGSSATIIATDDFTVDDCREFIDRDFVLLS